VIVPIVGGSVGWAIGDDQTDPGDYMGSLNGPFWGVVGAFLGFMLVTVVLLVRLAWRFVNRNANPS